jgi:hypothetical protein
MHSSRLAALLLAGAFSALGAQQPDTAKARRDSIALVRELERARGDTSRMGPQQAPVNPRLLPDISAVGDFVGDLSQNGSTQEGGCRLCVREVELALQAAVDPYFRGDVFLGISDEEGISVEQAFLTTTSLPWSLEARLGRFLMPVGKINLTHRHDLHTVEFPWVVQKFFGPEALKGTGGYLSRIFSPLGFYQELQVTAVDVFGEAEGLQAEQPSNREISGLGYSARLRNYWDLSESANVELSASAVTGVRATEFDFGGTPPAPGVNAINRRQSVVGGDLTFRWRPLEQGLYKSLIVQGELLRQVNEELPVLLGSSFNGAYGFARWQLTRRLYLGGRYDWVEDPVPEDPAAAPGATFTAASGYLEWFPSEFSKLMVGYERTMPSGIAATNRVLLQASFALGPHKPHPF